jgi:hypothetical protein
MHCTMDCTIVANNLILVSISDGSVWYEKQSPKVALDALFGHTVAVSQAASYMNDTWPEAEHLGCPKRVMIIPACTSVSVLERENDLCPDQYN